MKILILTSKQFNINYKTENSMKIPWNQLRTHKNFYKFINNADLNTQNYLFDLPLGEKCIKNLY